MKKPKGNWSVKRFFAFVLNIASMLLITFLLLNFIGLPLLKIAPNRHAITETIILGLCLLGAIVLHFKVYSSVIYPIFLDENNRL